MPDNGRIREIAPNLWQGALRHVVEDWETIKDKFETVLLLADEVERIPRERDIYTFAIPDDPDGLSQNAFWQLVGFAAAFKAHRVLTVCHMGENRSGLMSALILIHRGMAPNAAADLVQMNGPHNSPSQPHSFWNPGFNRQVRTIHNAD